MKNYRGLSYFRILCFVFNVFNSIYTQVSLIKKLYNQLVINFIHKYCARKNIRLKVQLLKSKHKGEFNSSR